jgi:hypothetical protein
LPIAKGETKSNSRFRKLILSSLLAVFLLVVLVAVSYQYSAKPSDLSSTIDVNRVSFSVEQVTTGIPNTVIFRYDLDGQAVDSLELQQSWDDRRRDLLDPGQNLVTSTYHSPGHYLAKLIADGVVLDSQHVYLPSNGVEVVEIRK